MESCEVLLFLSVMLLGDQVSRRGALTGGYHDMRKSRMEAWRRVDEQKQKVEQEEREKEDIAQKVHDIPTALACLVYLATYCVCTYMCDGMFRGTRRVVALMYIPRHTCMCTYISVRYGHVVYSVHP